MKTFSFVTFSLRRGSHLLYTTMRLTQLFNTTAMLSRKNWYLQCLLQGRFLLNLFKHIQLNKLVEFSLCFELQFCFCFPTTLTDSEALFSSFSFSSRRNYSFCYAFWLGRGRLYVMPWFNNHYYTVLLICLIKSYFVVFSKFELSLFYKHKRPIHLFLNFIRIPVSWYFKTINLEYRSSTQFHHSNCRSCFL